jgi:hypothetical protein
MRTNVHSVRTLVLILALALSSLRSSSQSITTGNGRIEVGLGLGPLVFLGDLGGNYGKGTRFIKVLYILLNGLASASPLIKAS